MLNLTSKQGNANYKHSKALMDNTSTLVKKKSSTSGHSDVGEDMKGKIFPAACPYMWIKSGIFFL